MAVIDRRSFIGLSAAAAAGCMARSAGPVPEFDDSLSVLVADAHVCGGSERAGEFTPRRLARFVDEVLSMRPLPKRVVHLGDLAYLYGSACDYAAARPHLKRLEDAGVELVFCMGNHDRRSEFDKAFPGHLAKSPVPGKCVSVASLGSADMVILDGLQGADDRPADDMGPGQGRLSPDQIDWARAELPRRGRPFLLASHYPICDLSMGEGKGNGLGRWLIANAPMCKGYVYGHLHRWLPDWEHGPFKLRGTLRTLGLPSGGLWGDIGYATLRTYSDRAVCRLEIRDFFFPAEPRRPDDRPAPWRVKVDELKGASCTFLYDREGV